MRIHDALKAMDKSNDKSRPMKKLKTPWTDQVTADNVWQEYPRPQMVREKWDNLNGLWKYAITSQSGQGAVKMPEKWDGDILVPFSPEALLSGVDRQLKPGETLWYKREFSLNIPQTGVRTLLHFGAVDERCRIWVNGRWAGSHKGGYLPFTCDITTLVHPGSNCIIVACRDDSDTSYHTRGKQRLSRGGMFYTAQSGIWQTVWLEQVPQIYLDSLDIRVDYDEKRVLFGLNVHTGKEDVPLTGRVIVFDQEGGLVADQAGTSREISVTIPDPVSWSPENPYLYRTRVELYRREECRDGEKNILLDSVDSYFAMRHVSVEQDSEGICRLCLNHKPYFQNGSPRALAISEYGGVTYESAGHVTTDKTYGYQVMKSENDWRKKVGSLIEQARSLEKKGLSAAVYTQVSDIEDEINGILTYDRQVNKSGTKPG